MQTEEQFKKEYKEHMDLNKKEVSEKDINIAWNHYKNNSAPDKPEKSEILKTTKRPKINIKISDVLKEIDILRKRKKNGDDVKLDLRFKMQELKELREEKKKNGTQ